MGKEEKDVERKEGEKETPRRKKKEDNQVTERVEGREVEGEARGREKEKKVREKGEGEGGKKRKIQHRIVKNVAESNNKNKTFWRALEEWNIIILLETWVNIKSWESIVGRHNMQVKKRGMKKRWVG